MTQTLQKSPTAVIADDQPDQRGDFRSSLLALWPELCIVGEAEDGIDALRLLGAHSPDVVFLDIRMPRLNGLEVAAHARGRSHVVFVTTGEQHALAAFEHGAIDYLLKPCSATRLATAIGRLQERLAHAPAGATHFPPADRWLRWINVSEGVNVRLIKVDEVAYFQATSKYTLVVTADRECLIRKPVRELLAELDPAKFWQVHRGTVVNVDAISSLHRTPAGHHELRLKTRGESLPVSATFTHRFRQM